MRERLKSVSPLFVVLVLIPTALAIVYYGFLASDVYVSESRFVVRSPTKANISPLAVLSGGGLSGASEENSAVVEYLQSRRALADSNRDGLVGRSYGSNSIFWLDRFGGLFGDSDEELYDYFLTQVSAETVATTQVTRLSVRAFDPEQARQINTRLLVHAEALVNALSERARSDSVAIAAAEVEEAKRVSRDAAVQLSAYRNRQGVLDPEQEAAAQLQLVSKLQDEMIAARTQLQQLETYTPEASQIPFLRVRTSSLQREIASVMAGLAGANRSLSTTAARYQELQLNSKLADKQLGAALVSLQEAQAEARRKRAYVERIADPSLPDYAANPKRLRGMVATFILGLLLWGVISMLIAGIREHRD